MTTANVRREIRSLRADSCLEKSSRGSVFTQNGWVLLFIAICTVIYVHGITKKNEVIAFLDQNLSHLQMEKEQLIEEKEDLLLQIHSQSDPAWVKLTLMKGLGLVPEGQLKVYFHSGDDPT